MMDRAVREIIFLLTFLLFSAVGLTQVHAKKPRERHLFVQRQSPLPGSPRKLLTVEREALDNFPCSDQQDAYKILSRVRRSLNPDTSPKVNEFKLNDSHYLAYVHWAGDHRDTIVVLTRDRTLTKNSSSHVWVSNNYGVSFRNLTKLFTLPDTNNGTFARIDMFYSSPVDNTRYLLVDTLHKAMYSTIDDFNSIVIGKNVSFSPDEICFHPSNSDVVLGYDESSSKLYYSTDFGSTWQLKDENVRSYFWGIPPWDSANTLYIEREEITGGLSNVIKTDYFSNFGAKVLVEGVHEFNMIDNYMFAVVPQSGSVSLTLKVSVNRSSFQIAQIPTASPTRDFFVADASENQVFLAVARSARTAHLYISDTTGIKYSLSMERVLYFSQSTSVPWLREYIHDRFVDLHKVKGLRGVYIASHLTPDRVGTRRIVTKITFDKGGFWQPVAAPKVDSNGRALNCSLPTCSLQLSQKFGSYFRDTHFTPVKSWRKAPGIIMATGTYGENLHRGADIFLSADAGLSWHMILQSPWWWYNLGDHGGIFIAVRRARLTNLIYYSWNEGETWLTYKFLDKSTMYVHGLLTEPGEQSAQFTIFGSFALWHKWIVVQIDLTKVLGPHNVDLEHKSPQLGKGVSAPRNVTAVPFNLTAVVLSWKPPQFGSTSHDKYYIFYGTVNSGVSAQPMGSATKERFVVGNLQADVVYVFEVSLGLTGPHSDPAHSLTKIDFPHPPVHSLQLRIVDVTTVYLSWNGTKGNDTSIRNYKITTSYNVGSESHTRTVYLVKTSYTFRYLKFNTDYTFAVQAKFNDNKLSDSVSARTKTGPISAPVDPLIAREHTDDTVTLSWSAPRTVNLSRIHYKLYWNCARCYSSYYWYGRSGFTSLPGTTTNYTLNRLYRGRTYFFSVHAETSLSNVGKNATASLVIGYYVGRVQNLKASVENYTMTVHWTPPNDLDPKEIKSYDFSYCNYSRASYCYPNNYGNVSKTVHQFEVAVLAGYTYSVNVYAVTPFGRGSHANVKHTVPPLSVKVSSVYSHVSGNYGLQLYIHWYWYYSYTYPNVEYEVSWHCVPTSSGSYCYWSPSYGWTTRVVNSRSLAVNVTHYDEAYKFDVVVITSRGRGEAYPLVVYIPPLNGIPGNFTCSVLKGGYYNSYLHCEWSKPTDVNPVGFYNYQLKYRCEDCIYNYFNYKYVYGFDATRANVTVSTGSRYQVYIQVSTRYGMGRSSAATVHVPSTVGRVLQLHAMVDEHIETLVKLTWLPPRGSHPEFYFVSYRCISCGDTTTLKVFDTHKQLTLFCGSYYNFSVRAVVNGVSGQSSETVVRLASNVDAVTNLAVHLFSVKVNNSQNVFGVDEGFLLTWKKPQNAEDIETYEIVVRRVDSDHIIMANRTAGSETRWRLSSYENPEIDVGQNYSFEVRSKARLCYGKKSVVFAVLPVGEVRNLVAVSDNEIATTAHLSWSSPAPRTPAQQYYIVHITCSSCGINFSTVAFSTFFKQKGLSCGNTYKVMVRAVINGIFGKETKTSLTVDPKIGAVTNLAVQCISAKGSTVKELSKEGFHLTWTKPNNVTNIEVETYEIIVRRFDRDQPIITSNTSGNKTHWTLSWSENPKIDVGQNYSFEVRAKARSCYGVKNVVFALLPVGQVLNLVAKPDKEIATTAHLSWNSPASKTSVQYYTVNITCSSCGINIFTVAFSTFFNQKGLPCGNTYYITVRAVIRGIFGEETKTWFKVDPKIGAVTNLAVQFIPANGSTVEELSKEGFHLTWAKPNNLTDNEIESYEIKVRGPDKGQLVITAHTKETQWTIRAKDNLFIAKAQNFSFEVRCKAKSCHGPITTVSALAEALPSLLPSPVPIKQGSRKGMSPVVWAVPVGIVSLILIAVIIFFAMKYRRLERSMYALLIRRTASVSEDDELPLLQTFSDDEPLINA